jgi:hypothetical protein
VPDGYLNVTDLAAEWVGGRMLKRGDDPARVARELPPLADDHYEPMLRKESRAPGEGRAEKTPPFGAATRGRGSGPYELVIFWGALGQRCVPADPVDVGYDLVDVVLMPASRRGSWRASGATALIADRTVSICELITSMVLLVAST